VPSYPCAAALGKLEMSGSERRRIFGTHAPHPHPTKSAPPPTAISRGPRDLAARLLRSSLTH